MATSSALPVARPVGRNDQDVTAALARVSIISIEGAHLPARPDVAQTPDQQRAQRLGTAMQNFAQAVGKLDYPDFRTFVAVLTHLRAKETDLSLQQGWFGRKTEPLKVFANQGLPQMQQLLADIRANLPSDYNRSHLAMDAQLIARRACRVGGVNVVNPDAIGAVLVSQHVIRITSGRSNNTVEISPIGGGGSSRVKLSQDGAEVELKDGQVMVVGRGIGSTKPFGMKIDLQRGVSLGPVVGEDKDWSRGALLIARLPTGQIAVFDRGSLFRFTVETFAPRAGAEVDAEMEMTSSMVYDPKVVQGADGKLQVGESIFGRSVPGE